MQETAAHPNRLLADLTSVMRTTAEASRQAAIEQSRSDAEAYRERLRAQGDEGTLGLQKAAEEDVATLEGQSKASVERVRAQAEERITRRRELLEQELQGRQSAVDREIERVQAQVASFEAEVSSFFEQLQGVDAATFATMASQAPAAPSFDETNLQAVEAELAEMHEASARAAAETVAPESEEELPAGWWLDSPTALAERAQQEEEQA